MRAFWMPGACRVEMGRAVPMNVRTFDVDGGGRVAVAGEVPTCLFGFFLVVVCCLLFVGGGVVVVVVAGAGSIDRATDHHHNRIEGQDMRAISDYMQADDGAHRGKGFSFFVFLFLSLFPEVS